MNVKYGLWVTGVDPWHKNSNVYLNKLVNEHDQFYLHDNKWNPTPLEFKEHSLKDILTVPKLTDDSRRFILNLLIWEGIDL